MSNTIDKIDIYYDITWSELFEKWLPKLTEILKRIYNNNRTNLKLDNVKVKIYPEIDNIFRVFRMSIDEIKIVLLGQDPYHGSKQANGLAFAVNRGTQIPPSLRNIFKQLQFEFPDRNYNFTHGDLTRWQNEEGIFLLNTSLTVIEGKPNSHSILWEEFTNDVISYIYRKRITYKYYKKNNVVKNVDNKNVDNKIVFLLLGRNAQKKAEFVDMDNIITASHPSPLSAHNGFLGTNVFQQVEKKLGHIINWSID